MTANPTIGTLRLPRKYGTVWNSLKPYQIWYGSRGSSKSWTKAIQLLLKSMSQTYYRGIFARDTQKNVRASQYQLFIDLTNDQKRFPFLFNQFRCIDGPMKVVCKQNNNFMLGGSFEQPDTLRSVADPTDFWAEEPITRESQINKQDFFDIVGSLRNSHGVQTQFHFTFNPISKLTWIYEDFFENALFDAEILKINYWENPFCPEPTVTFLESLKVLDPKRYLVDGQGEWGVAHEGLIYKEWEPVDEMPEVDFYGVDFGYTNPTAVVECARVDTIGEPKEDLFWRELLYESGHTSKTLIERFETLKLSKDKRMICDSARPEMIKDLRDAGYNAVPCLKYQGSVKDGISEVLKYNLKIVKGSRNLFDEVSSYSWDQRPDGKLGEEPAKNSIQHGCDAGRYATEGYRKSTVKVSEDEQDAFMGISL